MYLIIILIAFLATVIFIVNKTAIPVDVVLAGDVSKEVDMNLKRKVTIFDFFFCGRKIINPSKYKVLVVGGNSMNEKGLYAKDLIFVEKFKENDLKINNLKEGDIILLEIHGEDIVNNGKLKIREFVGVIDSDRIQTKSYEDNMVKLSRPHKIANVIGKVKYKMSY